MDIPKDGDQDSATDILRGILLGNQMDLPKEIEMVMQMDALKDSQTVILRGIPMGIQMD